MFNISWPQSVQGASIVVGVICAGSLWLFCGRRVVSMFKDTDIQALVRNLNEGNTYIHYPVDMQLLSEWLGPDIEPSVYEENAWACIQFFNISRVQLHLPGFPGDGFITAPFCKSLSSKCFFYVKSRQNPEEKGFLLLSEQFDNTFVGKMMEDGAAKREKGMKLSRWNYTVDPALADDRKITASWATSNSEAFNATLSSPSTLDRQQTAFWSWCSEHNFKFEQLGEGKNATGFIAGPQLREGSTPKHVTVALTDSSSRVWQRFWPLVFPTTSRIRPDQSKCFVQERLQFTDRRPQPL